MTKDFDLRFKGDPFIYRYWDAIPCVVFGLEIAVMSGHDDDTEEFDGVPRPIQSYEGASIWQTVLALAIM